MTPGWHSILTESFGPLIGAPSKWYFKTQAYRAVQAQGLKTELPWCRRPCSFSEFRWSRVSGCRRTASRPRICSAWIGIGWMETSFAKQAWAEILRHPFFGEKRSAKSVLQVLRNLQNFGETSPKQQVLAKLQNRYCFWQKWEESCSVLVANRSFWVKFGRNIGVLA